MNVAIAGYGIEGEQNYQYFSGLGHTVTIADEKDQPSRVLPEGAKTLLGPGSFEKLNGFDLVVRTAGLAPRKIVTDGKIWSATNEFFAKCPVPIIGVTGTKGKGTTASLIASLLRAAGKRVHLVGNIGVPALSVLPHIDADDLVVYELSSFQLWDLEKSPHVAVVLMIEPDHLDVHANFTEYVDAKSQISRHQVASDRVIYNASNEWSAQIAEYSAGQHLTYPSAQGAHVHDGYFYYGESRLCSTDELQLIGDHNKDNACAAIAAVWPWLQDGQVIARGLHEFRGLPHRIELVRDYNDVLWYDDSFSSAPPATVVAVEALNRPVVLIAGGFDRGLEYGDLAMQLSRLSTITHIILVGQTGPIIAQAFDTVGYTRYAVSGAADMSTIVREANELATPGSAVLLSPGCASFDMFKNFVDRGERFQEAVMAL